MGIKKITFAHMGTSALAFKMLFQDLGYEVINPPVPDKHILSLGVKYSPEFACIPFKIVLGSYLKIIENNPHVIVSAGGFGPCRAGYYGEMHRRILNELGYNPDFIFFWPPLKKPLNFFKKIYQLKDKTSFISAMIALKRAWKKLKALDQIEILSHKIRAREKNHGMTTYAFHRGLTYLDEARTTSSIREAREAAVEELRKVPVDNQRSVLNIGIVGEIYVQLEPAANFHIEELLGNMAAVPHRTIFLTNFARKSPFSHDSKAKKIAKPFLPEMVGGHGQQSVGDVVSFSQQGYDGVIQLAPFTCIPEIVAKSLMPYLSKRMNIPVLTLFIDEQTGQAGVETRVEAFIDMIQQRQKD